MAKFEAEMLTRAVWDLRRPEVLQWLRGRGFTAKAAERAFNSFIETQVFVAAETGEPQLGPPR